MGAFLECAFLHRCIFTHVRFCWRVFAPVRFSNHPKISCVYKTHAVDGEATVYVQDACIDRLYNRYVKTAGKCPQKELTEKCSCSAKLLNEARCQLNE